MRDEYKWTIEMAKGCLPSQKKHRQDCMSRTLLAERIEELSLQIKSLKKSLKDENADTVAVEAQILKCQLEIKPTQREPRNATLYSTRVLQKQELDRVLECRKRGSCIGVR